MDFKPSIKALAWLAVLLVMLGVGIGASMGACNYGFKANPTESAYGWLGVANLVCWALAIWGLLKKLIDDDIL